MCSHGDIIHVPAKTVESKLPKLSSPLKAANRAVNTPKREILKMQLDQLRSAKVKRMKTLYEKRQNGEVSVEKPFVDPDDPQAISIIDKNEKFKQSEYKPREGSEENPIVIASEEEEESAVESGVESQDDVMDISEAYESSAPLVDESAEETIESTSQTFADIGVQTEPMSMQSSSTGKLSTIFFGSADIVMTLTALVSITSYFLLN